MCGIAGVVRLDGGSVARPALEAMTRTLRPRGPDGEGYFVSPCGTCGLGHTRLAIVDLAGGQQPLASEDGQVTAVVNGEIYNFRALRTELEARGYRFRTESDSEVFAHGVHAFGADLFSRLRGMWAAAIWDARSNTLYLSRDPMGQKPIFYAYVKSARCLLFGSELKAILAHPDFAPAVDSEGLALYLTYETVPGTRSILKDVHQLPPGGWAAFRTEPGTLYTDRHYRLPAAGSMVPASGDWKAELERRLRQAVQRRLQADVPMGVLLSGGIDSSLITALLVEERGPDFDTFSVSFDDPSFDESSHAAAVAKALGTRHHEARLTAEGMRDVLAEVADYMSEPLGDASILPTYLLSAFVRQHVKVALGGDGGDEFFLGYPTFQAERVARWVDRVSGPRSRARIASSLSWLAWKLPVSRKNLSFDFKLKRFAAGLARPAGARHQAWMGSFVPEGLASVLAEPHRAHVAHRHPYGGWVQEGDASYSDLEAQYADLYLAADVLMKVDRASMANGLEVRAPFLDQDVVELARAMPTTEKLAGFETKAILRRLARDRLPADIVRRPKKGFGVPIADWLRGPLRDWMHDLLAPQRLRADGWLDPASVHALIHAHEAGQADHRKPLWTLLAFQMWHDRFVRKR